MTLSKLTGDQLIPEEVYGVEAPDPLDGLTAAHRIFERLPHLGKPLLLVYAPSAERTALRLLQNLARLARAERPQEPVYFARPLARPVLGAAPESSPGLVLLKRASRFLNFAPQAKALLEAGHAVAATCAAKELASLGAEGDFHVFNVPEEDPAYCDSVADDLIAQGVFNNGRRSKEFDLLLQILIETGLAGTPLPLGLLASFMRLDPRQAAEALQDKRIARFIRISGHAAPSKRVVKFRGAWLAERMTDRPEPVKYPMLTAIVGFVDPHEEGHRLFLLNLLIALEAQGEKKELKRVRCFHRLQIEACRAHANAADDQLWKDFFYPALIKFTMRFLQMMRFRPRKPLRRTENEAFV